MFACLLKFPLTFFLAYSLSYLSTSLRIGTFRFHAGCRRPNRRLNLALVFCVHFILSYVFACMFDLVVLDLVLKFNFFLIGARKVHENARDNHVLQGSCL